ncbi:MAG: hypothetical protein NT120_02745 [Candidatus Aenigmarchaeota archaeon]|nr:hypothetical protein [Candidatus Aenigmarchaeota archaeon]
MILEKKGRGRATAIVAFDRLRNGSDTYRVGKYPVLVMKVDDDGFYDGKIQTDYSEKCPVVYIPKSWREDDFLRLNGMKLSVEEYKGFPGYRITFKIGRNHAVRKNSGRFIEINHQ